MARIATRAEVRQPGVMERVLGGTGGAMGGMGMAGSLLSSFAAGFVGSMVAQSFFSAIGGFGGDDAGNNDAANNDGSDETTAENDSGGHDEGDFGGGGDFDGGGGDFEV